MPARVLFVALDAAESTLLPSGLLPGRSPIELSNRMDTLPGAIWPEIVTGASAGRTPLYFHPAQLHSGEAAPRPLTPADLDLEQQFPVVAARAGRSVLAVDLPQTASPDDVPGMFLHEWGTHDRWIGPCSVPASLLDDVRRDHGDHPIDSCDRVRGGTRADYEQFRAALLAGIEAKASLVCDLLGRRSWDLAAVGFSESHCAGHQLWCFTDDAHPLHGREVSPALQTALADVYAALEAAVARIVASAGPDAAVVAVTSHGMGPYIGGYQLLPVVLARLGLGPAPSRWSRWHPRLGRTARRIARVVVPSPRLRQRLVHRAEYATARFDGSARAIALPNNRAGAIRLNLRGREPRGTVAPGAEAEALLATIRAELLALVDPTSGTPIVRAVRSADEAFGPGHHPDVPDLMVAFRTDLGLLEECVSPTVGSVRVPLFHPDAGGGSDAWPHRARSGDHTARSTLWLGPEPAGATDDLPGADLLDLAPTVLDLLDVDIPPWMEGRVLV